MSILTLPDKPSELIRLAVKDGHEMLRKSNIEPRSSMYWHKSFEMEFAGRYVPCKACLAGAVMYNSLGAKVDVSYNPWTWNTHTTNRLLAINSIRLGHYHKAIWNCGIKSSEKLRRKIRDISKPKNRIFNSRKEFEALLDELGPIADQFEEIGL